MEVLENEPVGVKQLLRAGKTQGAQQQVLKLIVGDTVLLTGADVVEVVPEVGAQMTGSVLSNQIAHQTTAVLHGAPLQHAVDRYVEHNGIHILQNVGIENAALAHNNPILNAALNKGALSHCLSGHRWSSSADRRNGPSGWDSYGRRSQQRCQYSKL